MGCQWRDGYALIFTGATSLVEHLQGAMQVSSFFQGAFRHIPPEERQQAFAVAFKWPRRRAFLLFLVNNGYLLSEHVASNYERQAAKLRSDLVPCDAVFDVEDLSKYVCSFL